MVSTLMLRKWHFSCRHLIKFSVVTRRDDKTFTFWEESRLSLLIHLQFFYYQMLCSSHFYPVCDGTQNVEWYRYRYFFPVPNISDTDTGPFFGTNFFRYRSREFFPIRNLTNTGSETFFPVPDIFDTFSGTFIGTKFSDTGSDTTRKMKNSRYRYLYGANGVIAFSSSSENSKTCRTTQKEIWW